MSRLRDIERRRFLDQLTEARRRLQALTSADADPFVLQQTQRNIAQLQAASEGRTPSAVVDRAERHPQDDHAERLALARDEAVHTAHNALTFLERDPKRCARWLLRLDLELLDALPDAGPTSAQDLALTLLHAPPGEQPVDAVGDAVRGWITQMESKRPPTPEPA